MSRKMENSENADSIRSVFFMLFAQCGIFSPEIFRRPSGGIFSFAKIIRQSFCWFVFTIARRRRNFFDSGSYLMCFPLENAQLDH